MNKKITLLLLMMAAAMGFRAAAQLSGTYTINSAVATGGTNYQTFTAAVSALTSSGVSGPVVFNVAAGTSYTGQVSMGAITGASATNTIKFNGNGATVNYTASTTYMAVLQLDGAKYVKFDSLTFNALGTTYAYGAIVANGAKFDSITRCTFNVTQSSSTTAANTVGLRISATTSTQSTSVSGADSCYFGYNSFNGPTGAGGMYYGIYQYGPSTGNVFDHNTIANFYYHGIYNYYYSSRCKFLYNDINRATKTSVYSYGYGFYNYYACNDLPGNTYIGNRIHDFLGSGTYSYTYTYFHPFYNYRMEAISAAEPSLFANNAVYNMPIYYNYIAYYCANLNFYHNTISANIANSTLTSVTYLMYMGYNSGTVNIKNNIITLTGGTSGTQYGMYNTSTSTSYTTPTIDYNDIYISPSVGTANYAYWGGTTYATQATFQTGTSLQTNGLSVDPQYTSVTTGNLKPANTALTGAGTNLQTIVPQDILLAYRPTAPTIGAYENNALSDCSTATFPTSATITTSVDSICGSDSVKLSLSTTMPSATGITYQWQTASSTTGTWSNLGSASSTSSYTDVGVSASKYYRLLVLCNGNTALTSDTAYVHVTPIPDVTITNNTPSICPGDTTDITLSSTGTGVTFAWTAYATGVTGASAGSGTSIAQTLTTTSSGSVVYTVTPTVNGCAGSSDSTTVTVQLAPTSVSIYVPENHVCSGIPVTLTATPVNGGTSPAYQWMVNGASVSGANGTTYTYAPTDNDMVTCQMTSSVTCAAPAISNVVPMSVETSTSPSMSLSVSPSGSVSSGTAVVFTATLTDGGTNPYYKWYKNGQHMPAVTGSTWAATAGVDFANNAQIHVRFQSVSPCADPDSAVSNVVTMTVGTTGINNADKPGNFKLYPNPATEKISVEGLRKGDQWAVYDMLGHKLLQGEATSDATQYIDLSGHAAGIYWLSFTTAEGQGWRQKVEKR
ncbi:MAG: T9SS type A sorting domain-containing protein [Edaphocola sp.]